MYDVNVVVSACDVKDKSNLGALGTEVLEGGIGIHAHVNFQIVEGTVVQLNMAI